MKVCVIAAESAETGRLDHLLPGIDLPLRGAGAVMAGVRLRAGEPADRGRTRGRECRGASFRQQGHLLPIVNDRALFSPVCTRLVVKRAADEWPREVPG